MKRAVVLGLALLVFGSSFSQIIPENRTIDWSIAGQDAGFEDPAQEVNVMDFGAAGDGTENDAPAIQAAIESLNNQPGIVNFPSGSYLIEESISIPSEVILRGVDSLSTHILIDFDGEPQNALNISGSPASEFQPVVSGYNEGSTSLAVEDASVFQVGDYAELIQDNGAWYTESADWAENSVGQILKITAINGNTLTVEHPLRIDYNDTLNPRIRKIDPVINTAIEQLRIERLDEPQEGAGSNISVNLAANVRIKDIESDKSVGSHINVHRSTQVWLTGSYIHHAFTYDGSGTRGYGITLSLHTGECLIDNNVFEKLRHAMMVKTGSNGNVFGYNYSREPYRSETIHDYSGDVSLHGHYAFANLFEGNIVQNIFIDHYWGASGPYNTFFRNRAQLYGFVITEYEYPTDRQNIVGLEITNTDFLYGLYQINGQDHYEYGNNVTGDFEPFYTDSLPDSSYYLTNEPDFWNISDPWPSIGVPVEYNTWSIPAKERYMGNITNGENTDYQKPRIYPNPFGSHIIVSGLPEAEGEISIEITNLSGEKISDRETYPNQPIKTGGLKPGAYLIVVKTDNHQWVKKLIKTE